MRDAERETTVDSLAMRSSDVIGITEFPVEAKVSTVVEPGASTYVTSYIPDEYQDIKRYFERPRLIASVSAATTRSNLSSFVVTNPITQYWPANAALRLNGVFGYRCRLKFTVTLAATPFQQGLVASCWQYASAGGSVANTPRHLFPALVTNLPHVRLDFSDHTMAELDVPYMSPYEYFELANTSVSGGDNAANNYGFGIYSLNQVLPYFTLAATGAPILRIYLSLHDMELFGAVPVSASAIIPQSGITNHMDKQANVTSKGSVSGFLNNASKIADTVASVGSGVPTISNTASTVSWLTKKLANTAASLGYSKPVSEAAIGAMHPREANDEYHVDKPSVDSVVTPYQSNRLAIDSRQSGTDVDEMSLKFVLGHYAQAYVGNITTSDASGATLYATNLSPTSMWFRSRPAARAGGNLAMPVSGSLTTNCFCPTPLCYISQMFKYWRGSIKFRFSFAKTKFHAGRVMAAFIPSTSDTIATGVLSNVVPTPELTSSLLQPFQYSVVFDLRDASSFEFTVPFVSTRPFISTLGTVGGVTLTVMDPMLVTGESSSTIPYLVEVCAGDDYELGDYVGSGLAPAVTAPGGHVQFQSGLNDDKVTQYTMGEKYSSLKELIMAPYTTAATIAANGFVKTTLPQFYYAPLIAAATPMPNNTSAVASCSVQNCVSRMYAFAAGGTTYGAYFQSPANKLAIIQQYLYDRNAPVTAKGDTRSKVGAHKTKVLCTGYNAALYAKAPSYQKNLCIPTDRGTWNANWTGSNEVSGVGGIENPTCYNLYAANSSATPNVVYITYAASDDARLWAYVGPPPCWLLTTTQTADLDASNFGAFT